MNSFSVFGLSKSVLAIIIANLIFPWFPVVAKNLEVEITTKHNENASKNEPNNKEKVLDFSGTGRPGQQTAGDNRGNCPYVKDFLTAITPTSNWGKTTNKHPSFWFYLPYNSQQIKQAEFVLQDRERKTIFSSPLKLEQTPGYNRFSVPETAPILEVGQSYRWYIKLYCDRQIPSVDNYSPLTTPLFVQGWVERIPLNSNLYLELRNSQKQSYQVYGNYGIWYDAVNELLSRHLLDPNNQNLNEDWLKLTQAKGVNLKLPQLKQVKSR